MCGVFICENFVSTKVVRVEGLNELLFLSHKFCWIVGFNVVNKGQVFSC